MKFSARLAIIEAITFNELVQYGRDNGANIVNGMPWSFNYKGHAISHENDACYIVPSSVRPYSRYVTPNDVLVTGADGQLYPCNPDIFAALYDEAEPDEAPGAPTQPPIDNAPGCEQFSDSDIEQAIQAKGLTAPRITPDRIDAVISCRNTFTVGEALRALGQPSDPAFDLLTICALKLVNGFTVTGESACASPENFDAEIGAKIALDNAKQKIWPLEGYFLKSKLADDQVQPG